MKHVKKIIKRIIGLIVLVSLAVGIHSGVKAYQTAQQVERYRTQVEKLTKAHGIATHTDVVLGMIYTESKGRGIDLLQSSESLVSEKNAINNQQTSLAIGVAYFSKILKKNEQAGCDFWTAVQAYNFGEDYINYVAKHGKKNTLQLSEHYSKEVLSPLLGNTTQQKYRYLKMQSILYNGGYLYKNGGNLFYADVVKFNTKVLKYL
jgi:hypothetical protein